MTTAVGYELRSAAHDEYDGTDRTNLRKISPYRLVFHLLVHVDDELENTYRRLDHIVIPWIGHSEHIDFVASDKENGGKHCIAAHEESFDHLS